MRLYKSFLEKLARLLAYVATCILPKRRAAVLRGFPAYEDNLLAIYDALAFRAISRVIWIVDDPSIEPPVQLRKDTTLVKRGGLLDIYYSITSRFIFITHGHFLRRTPANQVCVNLWHGIPFKAIGTMQGLGGRSDTFLVATSSSTQKIFAQSFGIREENVVITGQARTDRMLNASREDVLHRALPNAPPPKLVLFWLPTFRQTSYFEGQCDGLVFDNIFNCSDFSVSDFNSILRKHEAVCFVKPHPMAVQQKLSDESNIRFIDETWLSDHGLSLYELIGATDCLISDISSVIADFMLLDRPIVLLFEDIVSYEKSRGFSFNPITRYLPAKVSRNFESFTVELEAVLKGQDSYSERRAELKELFFSHTDACATNRILDIAMGEDSVAR